MSFNSLVQHKIETNNSHFLAICASNPEFLDGRRQPLNLDQKPIIWQDFCQKLQENDRNWTGEGAGGACVPGAP